jgi:hypothetical protein
VLDEIIKCIGQLSTIVTTTIFKTSYVQGIYVQGAGTQEKPYYAHSARVAGWSQVLERWEKPGAFAVSDTLNVQTSLQFFELLLWLELVGLGHLKQMLLRSFLKKITHNTI